LTKQPGWPVFAVKLLQKTADTEHVPAAAAVTAADRADVGNAGSKTNIRRHYTFRCSRARAQAAGGFLAAALLTTRQAMSLLVCWNMV
jgi:hypothetical protein